MICSNCNEYELFLNFEEFLLSNSLENYNDFEEIHEQCIYISEEDFNCDNCKNVVLEGESYIGDKGEFHEIIFKYLAEIIMKNIACCTECGQGGEIQSLRGSIKSCYYDEDDNPEDIFERLDTARTIKDVIYDVFGFRENFWYDYYENIVKFIQCPICPNGSGPNYDDKIDYGEFNLYTNVYTNYDLDQFNHNFYGDELKDIYMDISELAKNFSFDELVSIKNDYINNKTIPEENPLLHKLELFIKELFTNKKYYILPKDRLVFRTRTSPKGKALTKTDLWEPPCNAVSHGRYNDIGVSILYCANNRNGIKKEIKLHDGHMYNIAKLMIYKPMFLFPINHIFNKDFSGLIDETIPNNEADIPFKQQYIFSNIVSAICFKTGYDGIAYRSTKDFISTNYALFCKYNKEKDIDIINIELEL